MLEKHPSSGPPETMRILLYNPDNGVTGNFMPHLWMFLLQARTPPGHDVLLLDGNARPMTDAELVQYVKDERIDLVGIGAMTRMIALAYTAGDALRAAAVPVVMGGPHVTELPQGSASASTPTPWRSGRRMKSLAQESSPTLERGQLKDIYAPVDAFGQERKPDLGRVPARYSVGARSICEQFNRMPEALLPHYAALRILVGSIPSHPHRVRPRLSLWVRILHGDRILRRLDPFSNQSKRRR